MKKLILSITLLCVVTPIATAEDASTSRLTGTWFWGSHRHERTVTYKSDGTYYSVTDGNTGSGSWKMNGDQLVEIAKGSTSAISSRIVFDSSNSFTLDGFEKYYKKLK